MSYRVGLEIVSQSYIKVVLSPQLCNGIQVTATSFCGLLLLWNRPLATIRGTGSAKSAIVPFLMIGEFIAVRNVAKKVTSIEIGALRLERDIA